MGHDTVTRFALDETMAADAGYGVSRRRQGEADWIRSEIVFQKRLRFLALRVFVWVILGHFRELAACK